MPDKTTLAKAQRQSPTPSEAQAWALLRNRQILNLKFRRQHVFRGFIVDFYCPQHRLAIEIDGAIHHDPQQSAHDAERTEILRSAGVRVLRIPNEDVSTESLRKRIQELLFEI